MRLKLIIRLGLSIFSVGAFCLSAQELHSLVSVHSNEAAISLDASSASDMTGASITVRNNSASSIVFPDIRNAGSISPFGAAAIVAPMKGAAVSDEDFAIKSWSFMLDHATHYCSAGSAFLYASDPMQILYGYGVGCCDQIARILGWLWRAAGYDARVGVMAFHTVPEIYYGGAWHMLDPDHRTFYRDNQGSIASLAEIFTDPSIVANGGDSSGRDPAGYLSQTMAQLYADNASTLSYASIPAWPDNGVQYSLAPGESARFTKESSSSTPVVYQIPEYNPVYSGSFGSVTFERQIDFARSGISYLDGSSGVQLTTEADGRKALTVQGSNGSFILSKTSPFPIQSLKLKGEFFLTDSSNSLSVQVSVDGAAWGDPIQVPVVAGSAPAEYPVDLTSYVFGRNAISVRILLNGSFNCVQIFSIGLEADAQFSQKMFPMLQPGQLNVLSYRDLSASSQPRAIDVELAIPNGRGDVPITSVESLVPEDPWYSLALNYGARKLIDGLTTTLAYPGSTRIDYVLALEHPYHVKQISLWWGTFGTDPIYVKSWTLYGRNAGQTSWTVLSEGGFPNAPISDIQVDANAADLRLVATSDNWIGLYQVKAYGDEITPPATPDQLSSSSQVPENPVYSLASHYGAANLTDGNPQSLAYPGATNVDYVITLAGASHVSGATITWGYFGTNPIYINSWSLFGRSGTGSWSLLSSGGYPSSETTVVPLNAMLTDLRIVASSTANWIGIYELQIAVSHIVWPAAITSNIALNGDAAYPTSNLSDGNLGTLAYPGTTALDYELDFGSNTLMDGADINWGTFGSDPIYIRSWELLGQQDQDTAWTSVAHGGFPNSSETWAEIHRTLRKLRIRATGPNWIGASELSVYGLPLAGLSNGR